MRKRTNRRIALVVAVAVAALMAPSTAYGQIPWLGGEERRARVQDGTQPGAQDVYFFDGDSLVNPDGDTPGDAQLFTVGGVNLGLTWEEYAAPELRSLAIARPRTDTTLIVLGIRNLVPNGVYSLFYTTFGPDSDHPDCPGVLRELPTEVVAGGIPRPDPSSFTADKRGRAAVLAVVDIDMHAVDQLSLQVIYHADGGTYHPFPNRGAFETQGPECRSSFGVDAMRQVFILQKWTF